MTDFTLEEGLLIEDGNLRAVKLKDFSSWNFTVVKPTGA